jgi:hypothetical protein
MRRGEESSAPRPERRVCRLPGPLTSVRGFSYHNCVPWGSHDLPPQAGIGVYERGPDGLLAAARVYDDVEAPGERP